MDISVPLNGPEFAGPGVGLRGLLQPVYPPIAHSAISPQLDCFQALGDKNAIRLGDINEADRLMHTRSSREDRR